MSTGSRIYRMRKAKEMTQEELGEKMGVSFQSVSSWERDETLPDTKKMVELARALDTSVGYLLDEDGFELPDWVKKDRVFSEERMHTFVKGAASASGLQQTLISLQVSKKAHDGQKRRGGDVPYINHPLSMACHALAMGIRKDEVLAAILLHDVVEDCPGYTLEGLPVNGAVRELVDRLTHTWESGKGTDEDKRRYYERISENPDATFVKVIDRCNNLSMMATGFTKKKMASFIQETEKYVFPMIEDLKENHPEYNDAMFLVKYQMASLMETVKRLLAKSERSARDERTV